MKRVKYSRAILSALALSGCLRKGQMREAKRGRITAELSNPIERSCIWRAAQQHGEK